MDETWSSFLSVVAQFIQGGEPKNVQVKDGYCFVPPELEVGAFELCLRGDDGESVVASVNRLTFEVCEGFDPSGETPLPPSPDLYTQLIKEIDSGKKIAQSVREDADAGLFNGGWYTPSVTQTDENTLRMDFTPSKDDMPDVENKNITLPSGGGGTSDHSKLSNRDAEDQHPMSAITGLEKALGDKQPVGEYLTTETDPTVPSWAKQPDKPSYTADEVGALSSETLPEAINTALAQAKESGEFDGAAGQDGAPGQDGITPTIGDNGNWYLGDTDTGKPSRGETGQAGADGRDGADGQPGADGKSAYQYAVDGGYTGTEEAFAAKLSKEMPDKLPNPNALTFTGAVTGRYDGSEAASVEIPSGGGGLTVTNTASAGQTVKITAVDETGQPTEWEAVDMASASAVTPELLYSGTAENVTSFQQDIGFKGHRNLVIVVSGTKGDAAISMYDGSLYMDGNRFVFAYYSTFLSAASESAPKGCVVYTICRIGSDRCRVDFSNFSNYSSPFWEYLQASSSTQTSARTCYMKSAASTTHEKIKVGFSASVPAVAVEVYGF